MTKMKMKPVVRIIAKAMTLKDKEEDVQNNVIVVSGWKKSNGEIPKNKELLVQLDQMVTNLFPKTEWIHVKAAHNRKRPKDKKGAWLWDGNDRADKLADEGRKIAEKA